MATAVVAGLAVVVLAGCTNTTGIDTVKTTALGYDTGDIGTADLAAGRGHFRDANYGLAEKHFRKAVELRASNAEAWMGLAAAYDQLGRFDFADRAYAQLLKLAGRQPRIVSNMGYSHYLRGDRKKARLLLDEARRAMPGDKVVEANIKLLRAS
ncbi:tetratricopeptide repeat protein [Nitratireductor arenosus]|nr:tetratricopeptide repeat protein [Nitratireductor arenosus]